MRLDSLIPYQEENMQARILYIHLQGLMFFYLIYGSGLAIYAIVSGWDLSLWVISLSFGFMMTFIYAVIFVRYWNISKDVSVEVNYQKGTLIISNKKEAGKTTYNLTQINRIERYCTFPIAENRSEWFPWDCFNYARVTMDTGETVLITSFMIGRDINIPVSDSGYSVHKLFYPYPPESHVMQNTVQNTEI